MELPMEIGKNYDKFLLETYQEGKKIRVRPHIKSLNYLNVWFPNKLRNKYPVGTIFEANVRLAKNKDNINPHIVAKPSSIKVLKLSNQKFESIIEENRKIKKSQLKNPSKQKTKTPRSQKIVLAGEVGRNKNQEEKNA